LIIFLERTSMNEPLYRNAIDADAVQIAKLHADSWRANYRGMLNEDYLNGDIDSDRLDVWTRRIGEAPANQLVIVGEQRGEVVGFVCVYEGADPEWGALIDNLHVRPDFMKGGIGTQLLLRAGRWLSERNAQAGTFLWVMEANVRARRFYERLGATNSEQIIKTDLPGGSIASNCRYTWRTAQDLAAMAASRFPCSPIVTVGAA
jgi:ribosomal protein S18 acetylase RimI-like enzyme